MPPTFPIQSFLNVRAATGPSFSPDGRVVAFLTNTTGVAQLWRVPVEGGWPTQLTFTHESVRGAWFSPRRHEIVYSMDVGGDERTQLFHMRGMAGNLDHDLGEGWVSEDFTHRPQAIHTFGGWSHDGRRVSFSANRDEFSRFDVFVQTIGEPEARLLQRGPGGYYMPVGWSPDDETLLIRRAASNFDQDLYLLDVASGQAKHLTPHQGDVQYHSPCFSGDGTTVYVACTAGGRDRTGLAAIDVASGRLTYLVESEHEIEDVHCSEKGRWLAYTENVDGRSVLHVRDLHGGPTVIPELPLGVVGGVAFSPDERRLAIGFDGPRHNPDVWLLALDQPKAKPRQLTFAGRGGLPFSTFVEPVLIRYRSFDGLMIPAWFCKPKGVALPPVIVYPHGGPESQTRPNFSALFQYFVQQGYAVLAPNVRGSTGYGAKYMNLDNTTQRMDSVADLAHAAYWLRDQKQGDPKRIAVYGGSYGGFMVLSAITTYPDLWAAGIDVVGICNFVTFLEKTGAYRRANREAEYGNLREHRTFLEKISPLHQVDRIRCPLMVIHGANDPRVPVEEAEQIVAALKKRNHPVEYLRYEDEGHGLAKLKNRLDAYPKMVAFLDRYLQK
jgi:dipeptidyl aminopeptidase/acylaminoacyl peptidase